MKLILKPHYILALIFCVSEKSSAQNIEQLYMKSGSVVEGYIAEQKPGSYITVQSTKATIVVNSDSLQNKIIERVPIDSLSKEWKQWATENSKWIVKNLNAVCPCLVARLIYHMTDNIRHNSIRG